MMNVTLLVVGKLKEKFLSDGCAEYAKRLGAFCRLQIVELPEYRLPESPSPALIQSGLEKEGAAILAKIPANSAVCALCIEGKMLSSEGLAEKIRQYGLESKKLVCIIGSSHGLADEVKARADMKLSFSPMTFPHQLARMILLEQLYRAFSINQGGKYHK